MFWQVVTPVRTFFHSRIQSLVAQQLFPPGNGDWYVFHGFGEKIDENGVVQSPFDQMRKSEQYGQQFENVRLELEHVNATLADSTSCKLEMLCSAPLGFGDATTPLAGFEKHVVYFTGVGTHYQDCFKDITTAVKETGATYYAFNYPGASTSTGRVKEAKDLINAGIAVVNCILIKGVHPDDIILQGDSFGAAIAYEVKKQFKTQSDIQLRIIMNNTFKSFKAVVNDKFLDGSCLLEPIKPYTKTLLIYTGWHVTPGKDYKFSGPYQCHIQHEGDQTLSEASTLSGKVNKYTIEARQDDCPAEYVLSRNKLDAMHVVRVTEDAKKRLAEKFGVDKAGAVDAHFADLCEMEMAEGGGSVYTRFICEFMSASDRYIKDGHQQTFELNHSKLPLPLNSEGEVMRLTHEEAQILQDEIQPSKAEEALQVETPKNF